MDKKKESFKDGTLSNRERIVKNCLIWLVMLVTVFWSSFALYVIAKSDEVLDGWPVFETTVFYTVYALAAYFMAEFIYCFLLRWAGRQYFPFVFTFGAVFACFVLSGVVAFAIFMEQAGGFWFEDLLSWRFLPCVLGAASFARCAFRTYRD